MTLLAPRWLVTALLLALINSLSIAQQIVSVSPNSGITGTSLTVSIVGQNTHFSQASSTNVVYMQHSQASSTLVGNAVNPVSNSKIDATFYIPGNAMLGNWHVFASNSINGTLKKSNAINVVAPEIVSVQPDSGILGQTLWVTITSQNTNFSQNSSVTASLSQGSGTVINAQTTTVNSATSVKAKFVIPAPYTLGYYAVHLNHLMKSGLFYINGGTSSISGNVSQKSKSAVGKDPVVGLNLFLMSVKNDTLLSTVTDLNGDFEFNYLAYGTYKIFGDNMNNDHPIVVVLDEKNPDRMGLDIVKEGDSLVSGTGRVPTPSEGSISIYPNPFNDVINIEIDGIDQGQVLVESYALNGRLVEQMTTNQSFSGTTALQFETGSWNGPGAYLIKVTVAGHAPRYYKLIKSE